MKKNTFANDLLNRSSTGWRYFDDRHVTESSEERIVSKYAYVLLYKRRSPVTGLVKPPAAQELSQQPVETRKPSLEDVDENELD